MSCSRCKLIENVSFRKGTFRKGRPISFSIVFTIMTLRRGNPQVSVRSGSVDLVLPVKPHKFRDGGERDAQHYFQMNVRVKNLLWKGGFNIFDVILFLWYSGAKSKFRMPSLNRERIALNERRTMRDRWKFPVQITISPIERRLNRIAAEIDRWNRPRCYGLR